MENPVIIFGAQTLGKTALDIFTSNNVVVYCFLDDDAKLHQTELNNIPVMGNTDDEEILKILGKKSEVFIAAEDSAVRKSLANKLKEDYKQVPVNAIHKNSYVSEHAWLGHGNLINAGAVVQTGCKIGDNCVIQSNAVIEANAIIGDFVQIGAGALINAEATIEDQAFIGTGAIIVGSVKIGKKARVGAGAVVIADVPANQTVFGNPAQKV
ncbi:acetyltransferase [Adhaeribacter sp. BT258]|uniref:Acetyltransferase n=1 Tax=Adhaeribacter terrigena TaxID=2793070 RepID=A0ABS1C0L7_9BACT|nr:acetyltransferase [Adhaeribacter terrigena]MBK0402138.1 acetyltransferase [Adhaeribacter terrigena]